MAHGTVLAGIGRFRWLLSVAIVALCGCAYALVHDGAIDHGKADQVKASLQQLRGLDFKAPVPLVIKTPDEAQRIIIAEIARDHSDEDLRIGGLSGAMTGLFPPGIDLKAETLKLLRSQIAGFYEPRIKQMVLVENDASFGFWNGAAKVLTHRDIAGEMLLAHELTHALQDQHFAIDGMLQSVKNNDDKSLALKSVAEGDATLAGFGDVAGGLDGAQVDLIVSKLANLQKTFDSQFTDVPEGLSIPLLFQYSAGTRFVAEAWHRGGWAAVDAIYKNPPTSTQQIMQPALYFDHFSAPARISLGGYQEILKGWKQVDDDTYGELLIGIILKRNLPPHAPVLNTMPNWAGDRILVFQKGSALTLLWFVMFRDDASAARFAAGYSGILDHLRGEKNPHRVETKSAAVLIVISQGDNDLEKLAAAVWKSSVLRPGSAQARPVTVNPAHPSAVPTF